MRILRYPSAQWAGEAACVIQSYVAARVRAQRRCAVMLTGGRSAERLYTAWARRGDFQRLRGGAFYFGDERCVPPDHPESNYHLAMRTLFAEGLPGDCTIHRMEADSEDLEDAASRYGASLPERVDCLLLGVGEDGHICSLFPHSAALGELARRVVPVGGPKPPSRRLTVTPRVLSDAMQIFVLADGVVKAEVLSAARRAPLDVNEMPVRMVPRATWLMSDGDE